MSNDALKLVKEIEKELGRVKGEIQVMAVNFTNDMENLQAEAKRLEESLKNLSGNVITKEKFAPYEKLLGVIGVAVTLAIVAAFMASILK